MKSFPGNLLLGWPELWRYPELVAQLASDREALNVESAVDIITRGITRNSTATDSLRSLLAMKAFGAAHLLLESPAFIKEVGDGYSQLAAEVADTERRTHLELTARRFELAARATRLNTPVEVEEYGLERVFAENPSEADQMLGVWARDLDRREQEIREELERRVEERLRRRQPDTGRAKEWAETVRGYLRTSRFDLAENLLASDSAGSEHDDPEAIPRSPRWHYDLTALNTIRILRGFERPPDVGFVERWSPTPEDLAALNLLEWLERHTGPEFSCSAEDAGEFARLLDEFLTGRPARPREVEEIDDGYITWVYEVYEPRILRLAGSKDGVPLWIARSPEQTAPSSLADKPAVLAFHPESAPVGRPGLLGFEARMLFPLLRESSFRKVNFLRRLMLRISLEDTLLMPPTLNVEIPGSAWSYAAWFLDYLGIKTDSPSTLDLITFYGSGRGDVLTLFLSALVESVSERYTTISSADVHGTWRSTRFRNVARDRLLGPYLKDPEARAVLGCVYYLIAGGEELEITDLLMWLAEAWDFEDAHAITAAAEKLNAGGLLMLEDAKRIRLPKTGITHLIRVDIGDPESYIRSALEQKHKS
jgi:hypothetical protein